jgi:ferric-chelate reductase
MYPGRIMHLGKPSPSGSNILESKAPTDVRWNRYIGYAYWAAILFLGMASHLYSRMIRSRKARAEREVESNTYPTTSTRYAIPWMGDAAHWVQTHLIVPAPLTNGGRKLLGCTFTNRGEALVVVGFWLLSTVLSVVGYRTFPGNI